MKPCLSVLFRDSLLFEPGNEFFDGAFSLSCYDLLHLFHLNPTLINHLAVELVFFFVMLRFQFRLCLEYSRLSEVLKMRGL